VAKAAGPNVDTVLRARLTGGLPQETPNTLLFETWYELGRMAFTPVTEAELDAARRYVLGSMALSTATHAGLASTLSALVGAGLPVGWLAEHQRALEAVTVEQVQGVSRRYLAPAALTAVVVGDAAGVEEQLAALGPLTVQREVET